MLKVLKYMRELLKILIKVKKNILDTLNDHYSIF